MSSITQLAVFYQSEGFEVDWMIVERKSGKLQGMLQAGSEWYEQFGKDKYRALFELGFQEKQDWMTQSFAYLHRLSETFVKSLSTRPDIEVMRAETEMEAEPEDIERLLESIPFADGAEHIDEMWVRKVWEHLLKCFRADMSVYEGTAASYFMERNSHIGVAGRIYFHLVESGEDGASPFAFMATYSTRPEKSKRAVHTPLKHALLEFREDKEKLLSLLSSVAKAADHSSLISGLMESGELFSALRFTAKEAYIFLQEIPIYKEAGIMCRVPDWWKRHTNSLRLSVSVGQKKPSSVGADALLDFHPAVMMDEEELTPAQLKEFLAMAEGLVNYKGKWVEINHKKLNAALAAFEKASRVAAGGKISVAEAMRMEMTLERELKEEDSLVDCTVSNGTWLKEIREKLLHPRHTEVLETASSFHAVLRPYQADGCQWLDMMGQLGFGACLADDMGLGKTVQVIAYLEQLRLHQGGHTLLIVPASLIGNWTKELERFAPEMTYQILHKNFTGSSVKDANGDPSGNLSVAEGKFLCITTYQMAVRLEELAKHRWDAVILDEAQAVKNAGTKQSKAVKAIPANIKIAMTGTPIENRLSDLWSLFDYLNPGLLGNAKEFTEFTKQLSEEGTGYLKLKKMVSPFILRRLKTDRSIITDLPDKIEIQEYASLSKKQTVLYKKLVKGLEEKLNDSDGIERKGLVLASIMKFKQICNHPDQYLGLEEYKKENSGKFEQLEQICETIYEKRERVLVFTQFKEMTEPLSEFLEQIFHKKGIVLHGGTPVKKRGEMVDTFNGAAYVPYMVLSLKAGGVGLNLTAANHVIHFDRWWNPAVENQATDRAFRIGQTKQVMVHKFVTEGTIEEKIDAMIAEKQKLAGDILGASAGETWITELNNEQLMNLFRLGGERL